MPGDSSTIPAVNKIITNIMNAEKLECKIFFAFIVFVPNTILSGNAFTVSVIIH